jgi:AcrR family transcriptional regulator/DNA-binding MarR family transcriptional regulator
MARNRRRSNGGGGGTGIVMGAPRDPRKTGGSSSRRRPGHGRGALEQRTPRESGRERVFEIQRARILAATVEVVREHGASEASVARIVARAGISRRTFYELYADREECLLAAFDHAVATAAATVVPAYAAQATWREGVRAGLTALLGFLDAEPGLGGLLVVDALGGGPNTLARRTRVLDTLIETVDRGRTEGKVGRERPPLTAEGAVGAVLSVIHSRMLQHSHAPLGELINPLMSMIVMPYFGTTASRRELHRPVAPAHPPARPRRDPLEDLDMRLTYRTMRVLVAIAGHPGISNRQVAQHAEIADQGQMSKLLSRLEHLGLAHNSGHGAVRGEPNAWTLTAKGHEVQQALGTESGGERT